MFPKGTLSPVGYLLAILLGALLDGPLLEGLSGARLLPSVVLKDTRYECLLLCKTKSGGGVGKESGVLSGELLLLDGVLSNNGLDTGVSEVLGVELGDGLRQIGLSSLLVLRPFLGLSSKSGVGIFKIRVHLLRGSKELLLCSILLHIVNMRVDVKQRRHNGTSGDTLRSNTQLSVER